jgi:tRNA modification GTPase
VLECRCADAGPGYDVTGRRAQNAIWVWTKADVALPAPGEHGLPEVIVTSAATGEGIGALRLAVARAVRVPADSGQMPAGTAARCHGSIRSAQAALEAGARTIRAAGGDELVAFDLRLAVDELGKVVGAVVTDDILDRIFSRFCIGK